MEKARNFEVTCVTVNSYVLKIVQFRRGQKGRGELLCNVTTWRVFLLRL